MKAVVFTGYLLAFLVAPGVLFMQLLIQMQLGTMPTWTLESLGVDVPGAFESYAAMRGAAKLVGEAPLSVVAFVCGLGVAVVAQFLERF